ncbi:hypothetical protein BU17DRAFT_82837 [Hysterangium stoloniferum]|nr:hypothetical protein BU17DRAFT_82837 [Hysterangium stoloniferum]
MSIMRARRPRIPVAFMPLGWTPDTPSTDEIEDPEAAPQGHSFSRDSYEEILDYDSCSMFSDTATGVFPLPIPERRRAGLIELDARRRDGQSQSALKSLSTNTHRSFSTIIIYSDTDSDSTEPKNALEPTAQSPSKLDASQLSAVASRRSARRTFKYAQASQRSRREQKQDAQQAPTGTSFPYPLPKRTSHQQAMHTLSATEHNTYTSRWSRLKLNNPFLPLRTHSASRTQSPTPTPDTPPASLRFFQIPWPLSAPIIFSPEEITLRGVEGFVLCPWDMPMSESERTMAQISGRARVENEMKRWEEEAFEDFVIQRVREDERDVVREGGAIVRAILWELLERG